VQPPHEPVTGSAPRVSDPETSPAASGESPPEAKPRRKGLRLWVAMVAGVAALLCLGGIGVAVLLYDKETKIERAAPDAVVDNFLRAYLVDRNDERASLYQCKSGGKFDKIASYRGDIVAREKQFSVGILVTWSSFSVQTNGANAEVTTDLTKTTSDKSGRLRDSWQFDLVDQNGWRVCGATAVF
jgi:hypothetical protein